MKHKLYNVSHTAAIGALFLFIFSASVHSAKAAYRGYEGELLALSPQVIRIDEGVGITVEARFKNTGSVSWKQKGVNFMSVNVASPFYRTSEFEHIFWMNEYQPGGLVEAEVAPGETGTFRFALQSPQTSGVYVESFMLSAEGVAWLRETEFTITMAVGDAKETVLGLTDEPTLEEKILEDVTDELTTSTLATTTAFAQDLIMVEPTVRVGLYKTIEPVIVTADTDYALANPEGGNVIVLPANHISVTYYDAFSKTFLVNTAGTSFQLPYAKFKPLATSTIFTIKSFNNPSKWQEGANDNRFRGAIEVQYGEKSDSPWVVNEIILEDYLKGIKETSEVSPAEYQKAIAIAARTYATWHLFDGTKHKGNNFTLDAVYDQVYRGVNTEALVPSFADAVDATHGVIITYEDEIAFTPYFAQSDGRTRTIKEAWGGKNQPYLQSVADPTNEGLKLWGHGVGMSARGALIMASRYGSSVEDILTHYYTDIAIKQRYIRGTDPLAEQVEEN